MDIKLTEETQRLVDALVAAGHYASAEDAIAAAVRLLDAHQRERAEQIESLRRDIAEAIEQIERGEYVELCSREDLHTHMQRIKAEGRRKLAEQLNDDRNKRSA